MELHELIEAVKAATDKDALAILVKTELDLELDRRKGLDTLRESVLAGLVIEPEDRPIDPRPVPAPDITQQGIALPEIGSEPAVEALAPQQRLLRNTKNGRVFVWTPVLARLPDLVEA